MSEITIDDHALQQARDTFHAMSQQMDQEIGRQRRLARQFDDAMNTVRRQTTFSQHTVPPDQLWYESGLSRVAGDSMDGRRVFEHMKSVATATAQHMIEAHPGPVGSALVSYATSIDQALGSVLSQYWDITDSFFPGNTIALSSYSSVIEGNFSQLGYWLVRLHTNFDVATHVIEKLLAGESAFIAQLTSGWGSSMTGTGAPATDGSSSASDQEMWNYLASRYNLTLHADWQQEGKDRSLKVGAEMSQNLWETSTSLDGTVLGVGYHHEQGVRLGHLTGFGGAEFSLDPKADHWGRVGVSAGITAMEAYDQTVYGSKQLGLTDENTAKVLSAEGFAGFEDGTFGAKVGFDAISVEKQVGVNIAGINVGLEGEVGLKAEFGFEIGKKVEVNLPFVSFGFAIGGAK